MRIVFLEEGTFKKESLGNYIREGWRLYYKVLQNPGIAKGGGGRSDYVNLANAKNFRDLGTVTPL